MKKNILKVCEFVFFFTAFFFMFGLSVNAYIDPSVVTYTIQVGAGIVIAIGAVVGIYYRKAKKKISNTLGIDENKNKEVESDEILEEVEEEKVEEPKEEVKKEKNKTNNKDTKTKKTQTKKEASSQSKTKKTQTKKTNKKA